MRRIRLALALSVALLALLPPAAAGAGTGLGQFVIRCEYSHSLPDDPIRFPGEPGASHLHDFFGNETVNAFSTQASLLAGTTKCQIPSDTAGYWAPAAYLNGIQLEPSVMRVYYLGDPVKRVETIPPGLQVIGGNAMATSPAENPNAHWYCGATKDIHTPRADAPYDCTPWSGYRFVDGVIGIIDMPNCWDGDSLAFDHVVYPVEGRCPSGYPHVLPKLSQRVHFGIMNPLNPDGTVALTLASGPYYTLHSDFWNSWQQPRLDQLVADCLDAGVHCGGIGVAPAADWTRQFGTAALDQANGVGLLPSGVFVGGSADAALADEPYQQGSDAFVRGYDRGGTVKWTDEFGTPATDRVVAIAVDDSGVYVAGVTDGELPGQTRVGGADGFVRRYGRDGALFWTRQFGTGRADEVTAIAVGPSGVYVAGATEGTFPGEEPAGGVDAFVRRFDLGGEARWTRQFGSRASDSALGLAVGSSGVDVVGSTGGVIGGGHARGSLDSFLLHYGVNGAAGWTRQFGTPAADEARGIVRRGTDVYVAGTTEGTFAGQTGQGLTDGFLIRFDGDGTALWTRQFGTAGTDDVAGVAADRSGLYVVGSTDGAFLDQTNAGGVDAYVRKVEPNGIESWTSEFGTPGGDQALGVAVDDSGAFIAGQTDGAFEGQSNAGEGDVFLVKLRFT